jgi:cyclic pyranopterin phosphate synthase
VLAELSPPGTTDRTPDATARKDAPVDRLGRGLRDLRISVTDRCTFRCPYCMPKEIFGHSYTFLPRAEILSFEEITRVVGAAASLGVTKVRLTGGEPLLRRDLEVLVAMLSEVDGITDLALTTNGALLAGKANGLRAAGLARVTVSLDSLDEAVFAAMNDVGVPLGRVLDGIAAAVDAGIWPVKLNTVVKRGVNDDGLVELARFAREHGLIARFIEYMDVGTTNGWRLDDVVPAAEIVRRIDAVLPLEPAEANYRGEVARRWRYRDGSGEVGVIASVTQPFCSDCTRARLSTDGKLYTCLFAGAGHDLRALLRAGASDEELREALAKIWAGRGDRYSEQRTTLTAPTRRIEMSYIGG